MSILRTAVRTAVYLAAFLTWTSLPLFSLPFAVCWLFLTPCLGINAMKAAGSFIAVMCLVSVMTLIAFTVSALIEYVKVAA